MDASTYCFFLGRQPHPLEIGVKPHTLLETTTPTSPALALGRQQNNEWNWDHRSCDVVGFRWDTSLGTVSAACPSGGRVLHFLLVPCVVGR
jgi:hypothetical protein